MMRLRRTAQSVLCCLLCLTVCAAPVLAANDEYTDGFFYWSNGAEVNLTGGGQSVNFLNGYFPATVSSDDANALNEPYRNFRIFGKPFIFSSSVAPTFSFSSFYVEVLFGVPAPLTVTISPDPNTTLLSTSCYLDCQGLDGKVWKSGGQIAYCQKSDWVCDDKYYSNTEGIDQSMTAGTYDVKRYFGYRFYFDNFSNMKTLSVAKWRLLMAVQNFGLYSFSDPDYVQGIFDEVTVNTGILQEINGSLTDIKTSTSIIQQDVSEIKDGLQDSNGSIWGAFKDSVSGLFVPSSAELEGLKDGFDQLAQEKLGGAYQTVELVDNGVQSVVNKFKNPGSSPGVEFPGISVPLGGDVGTVTLAASQTVTIPEQITSVLYPVAGVIIPIVCVIWTIRQCTDMVECFMSGMSYAEFLHRNSDEEDEEV